MQVTGYSGLYETAPMYVEDQARFLNAAVRLTTDRAPLALLRALKALEREAGRGGAGGAGYVRNGPRPLDLDIVFWGAARLDLGAGTEERLEVPHPRWRERPFVLGPVADLLDAEPPAAEALGDLEGVASAAHHVGLAAALWELQGGEAAVGTDALRRVLPLGRRAGEEREATVDFFSRPHVMGVLNATPDSFSDGGELVRARGGARSAGSRDD